jgi:hypothetical protein
MRRVAYEDLAISKTGISFTQFEKLIINNKEIVELKEIIKQNENLIVQKEKLNGLIKKMVMISMCLFFPIRYIFYGIKWSFKILKNNRNDI